MTSKIGLDKFIVSSSVIEVIRIFKKEKIACYDIEKKEKCTIFYTRIYDRKKVYRVLPHAQYLHTTGMIGMLYRNIKKPSRLLSYACIIAIWSFFSHLVMKIEVIGENDLLQKQIQQTCERYKYRMKDTAMMKETIYNEYEKDISWLEVYDKGNIVKLQYTEKNKTEDKSTDNAPLVAKKDGLIARFDCKSGYKRKKVNENVKKGELLVDVTMPDAFGVNKQINVQGKVYAYTWQKVIVEMKENKLPDAINYFSLLLDARDEIHIDIDEDERVEKENVLQFSKNKGKIKLEILYTLLEDITS